MGTEMETTTTATTGPRSTDMAASSCRARAALARTCAIASDRPNARSVWLEVAAAWDAAARNPTLHRVQAADALAEAAEGYLV
jgi:hypothetical protein